MKNIITHKQFSQLDPKLCHGFGTKFLGTDFDTLSKMTRISAEKIFFLKQIHSNKVVFFNSVEKHHPSGPGVFQQSSSNCLAEGDALITTQTDCLIGVCTADCLPILVYSPKPKIIAAIHAGWQGLLAGIIQSTVQKMISDFHCDPKNLFFLLGPSLRVKNFEMGDDAIEKFKGVYEDRLVFQKFEKFHLDSVETAKNILEDLNCDRKKIFDVNFCTYEREDLFFSYRRGHLTERQFSFMGLLSSEWKCDPEGNGTREPRQDRDLK